MNVCRFASALLLGATVFGVSIAAPLPGPIPCDGTPFGRRLSVGLDQEFVVVHAGTSGPTGMQSFVEDDPNAGLGGLVGVSNVDLTFAVPASIDTTHVDLDGDGLDEWAVAGISPANAKRIVVTTFRRDPANQSGFVSQGPVWEYDLPGNIVDLRVAAADVTGRNTDSRQELVVAVRDATQLVTVFVLNGAAGDPTIQQTTHTISGGGYWTMPVADGAIANLRVAAGDVLLEGRDQIVLMATATNASTRVFYVLRYNDQTFFHLYHTRYSEGRPTGGPLVFDLKIADFGGSPASELLVHDEGYSNDSPEALHQDIRYFTTTRDINTNAITAIAIHSAPNTGYVDSQGRKVAVAVGQLDRKPGAEIALARQQPTDIGNHLLVALYKVAFDVQGNPSGVVAYGSPQIDDEMFRSTIPLLDVTIRDQFGTGIGEAVVAVSDQQSAGDSSPVLKVNTYGMAVPGTSGPVNPATFARTSATPWPTQVSNDLALHVDRLDFDGDSVLADIGTTCARVREPMLRTVVHLPPYWDRLQGPGAANGWSDGFISTIGQTKTQGSTSSQTYSTSTSHDVSGYIGATVGGDFLGIGVEASVKATAGYTFESTRGESYGVDDSVSVGESQSQSVGEGLVVVESNMFECYSYNVHVGELNDPGSNIRSCELIRKSGNDDLRSFTPSDLVTWDTITASSNGQGQPTQWIPLTPDWASVALFHVPTANFVPVGLGSTLAAATDGKFATVVQSLPMVQPYIQIDLGRAQPLTNIRVFPQSGHPGDLDGFSVYVSTDPFVGNAPPSASAKTGVYAPDPSSGNGFDHWNVWLRDLQTQAPRVARYVRLQAPGLAPATLRISELEVFGDSHVEPPAYPQAVCDTVRDDGLFTALMYDSGTAAYRKVDVHGKMLWSAAPIDANCGSDFADTDAQHKDGVQHTQIWSSVTISGSGSNAWDLTDATSNVVGNNTSISHSARVGAELDVEAGAVVKANIGGAYEFSTGVTQDSETTMYWGSELLYAGGVGGFQPVPNNPSFVTAQCEYRTHPYAYTTSEHSNIGYEQQFTVIDYVVRDLTWSRGANPPPAPCYTTPPDTLFRGGFE